jgi:ubiquinone/menaquinone biosynthesis C-methylase UbiE
MRITPVASILVTTALIISACSPKSLPYNNGPVMSQKSIQKTFQPILEFMEYQPGMSFADVGAGSGALTVMMASLMDNSTVYIQDIDTSVLKTENLDRIIDFYSERSGHDLREKNRFTLAIGDIRKTNLPDHTFDMIYSNATVHNFTSLDSMVTDLGRKLKPNGVLFFRDSFKGDHGEGDFCSDPKCARPLLTIDEFLTTMKKNGFEIAKQSPDMSGYPVFGFALNKETR